MGRETKSKTNFISLFMSIKHNNKYSKSKKMNKKDTVNKIHSK